MSLGPSIFVLFVLSYNFQIAKIQFLNITFLFVFFTAAPAVALLGTVLVA